jgi:hypothetical protein
VLLIRKKYSRRLAERGDWRLLASLPPFRSLQLNWQLARANQRQSNPGGWFFRRSRSQARRHLCRSSVRHLPRAYGARRWRQRALDETGKVFKTSPQRSLSAMRGHSYALPFGRSEVGRARQTAIRFSEMSGDRCLTYSSACESFVWHRSQCGRAWLTPFRRPALVLACRHTPGSSSPCRLER